MQWRRDSDRGRPPVGSGGGGYASRWWLEAKAVGAVGTATS